jgi:hypothetical protein
MKNLYMLRDYLLLAGQALDFQLRLLQLSLRSRVVLGEMTGVGDSVVAVSHRHERQVPWRSNAVIRRVALQLLQTGEIREGMNQSSGANESARSAISPLEERVRAIRACNVTSQLDHRPHVPQGSHEVGRSRASCVDRFRLRWWFRLRRRTSRRCERAGPLRRRAGLGRFQRGQDQLWQVILEAEWRWRSERRADDRRQDGFLARSQVSAVHRASTAQDLPQGCGQARAKLLCRLSFVRPAAQDVSQRVPVKEEWREGAAVRRDEGVFMRRHLRNGRCLAGFAGRTAWRSRFAFGWRVSAGARRRRAGLG